DQSGGPVSIAYTEFLEQVDAGNVEEIFARGDTIQGVLSEAVEVPDDPDRTFRQFTTERPTFAQDDLLGALAEGGATVRATPLVETRGVLANLLFSFGPLLLLIAFWWWIFRRQRQMLGGGLFGGGAKKQPVDPE